MFIKEQFGIIIDFITRVEYQCKIIKYLESIGFETMNVSEGYTSHIHPLDLSRFDF